ncbi:serine/threonine-protein kinase [Paenarthrobacter nitroguajacolicus]|uniref:serine/threonine-protein kinase n=1 Tax=Paenarthrobacter nitroguajacolicus TaxID=211146 RepID=UPI003AD85A0E
MESLDNPAAVAPVMPGYAVSRLLGHGSTSTVWLATRDKDGVRFAVKCAGPDAVGGQATAQAHLETVSREMRLLSGLRHKHLIRVHDILRLSGTGAGTWGIVMDYAAGGSLANLVSSRGKLNIGEVVTILTPIAQALEYLHINGTEHGDVSPGNILFTAVGMPLLADLGVAAKVGDKPQDLDVGTPGFVEPAAAASLNGDVSRDSLRPQRDVYSLGAVGWYCLTGKPPEQERDRPPLSLLVPEVPKALAAALEAALDADPRIRPSARELGTAIFRSAAPEALDLAGAVHSSVIPELLTRRESLGRSPRRATSWLTSRWRVRPFIRGRSVPAPNSSSRQRGRSGGGLGRRIVLFAVMGALIGAASWVLWQQNRSTTATVQQVAVGGGVTGPGGSTELPPDLPKEITQGLQSEDPLVAVPALSAVRDIALGERRLDLLDAVNAPGSPAETTDKQVGDYLRDAGTTFTGLHTSLTALTVEGSTQPDRVMVSVTATTSGYEERLASGAVIRTEGAGMPQELRLDLVRSDGRWRISGILGAVPAR